LTKACTAQAFSDGSGMTQANLLACESSLTNATCDDVFSNSVPCNFNGTFASGATCGDNSQCAGGFCNRASALCGVCADKAGAGATCASGSNDECQSGLVCSPGKTCVAPARVGAACDDNTHPCMAGLFCTAAKTCALTVAVGEDCPGSYLNLADGTYCWAKSTATSPQIATQLGTAIPGSPCGLAPAAGQPATLCAPGGVSACGLSVGAIQLFGLPTKGTCMNAILDGAPCSGTDFCQPGAQCINNLCEIPSGKYCAAAAIPQG
jgi:hypothetical protein